MKKITVEDIAKNAEASVSYADFGSKTFHVYKLKMKLCKTKQYPKYTDVTVQDWTDVLNGATEYLYLVYNSELLQMFTMRIMQIFADTAFPTLLEALVRLQSTPESVNESPLKVLVLFGLFVVSDV